MADKKLLEETIIARFQQLANINGGSKAKVLTEGVKLKEMNAGQRSATPGQKTRRPDVDEKNLEEGEDLPPPPSKKEFPERFYEAEGEEADMAGDEMGTSMEGGDLEAAVQEVIAGLNKVLAASGMSDKEVELDSGSEEGGEGEEAAPEMDDMGDEMVAEADKAGSADKKMEEELDESIELVDDSLIEKLVQRVSARLVAEARKAKALEEGKKSGKAGNWLSKPSPGKRPAAKGNAVKGGTPFKGGKN